MATYNPHKLEEVRQILGDAFCVKSMEAIGCHDDIPETATTLEGNALEALDGAPGIFTARFGQMNGFGESHDPEANIRCLLARLEGKENRRARFRTVVALVQNGQEYLFEGIVEGTIRTHKSGGEGFGYDPIFEPEDTGLTFAEMGPAQKNAISHRSRAIQKLAHFLLGTETSDSSHEKEN